MFEGLVADILSLYLGKFVKGLDKENLKIAIFGGDVVLENLEIRTSALRELHLPVAVKAGYLGELRLKIPWSNLRKGVLNEPIVVIIRRIFLVAGIAEDEEWDEEEEERREQEAKQKKLRTAEALKQEKLKDPQKTPAVPEPSAKKPDGFISRLIQKAVDNIQVTVEKIHIRFEDGRTEHPFAIGFTLDHISAQSTDENWLPTFLNAPHQLVHKFVTLRNLSLYWDTDASFIKYESPEELWAALDNLIYQEGSSSTDSTHYIVRPVCGELKVILNKTDCPDDGIPKVALNFLFDRIRLNFEEAQYRDLLSLVGHFVLKEKRKAKKFRKYRPKTTVREDPQAWWAFAGQSVCSMVREKRMRWSSEALAKRRADRLDYIHHYKRKKKGYPASDRLIELEKEYSFEDLLYFRSLADVEMKNEGLRLSAATATSAPARSWTQWFWGSDAEDEVEDNLPSSWNFEFTPEQKKNFYASIGYDSADSTSVVILPKEYVLAQVSFRLNHGKGVLRGGVRNVPIISGICEELLLSLSVRPNSFTAGVSLGSIRVYDRHTPNTVYPVLVQPSRKPIQKPKKKRSSKGKEKEKKKGSKKRSKRKKKNTAKNVDEGNIDIFSATFDYRPLHCDADFAVKLEMGSLDCIVPPRVICRIVSFFMDKTLSGLKDLTVAARRKFRALALTTKTQLQEMLQTRKIIMIDVNAHAPLIIWPSNFEDMDHEETIVADLGKIQFFTHLGKPWDGKDEGDIEEEDFYNTFKIKLSSLQLMFSPYSADWRTALTSSAIDRDVHLVDKFDINISFQVCKVLSGPELAKVLVIGDLPALQVYLSPHKIAMIISKLLRLVDDVKETLFLKPIDPFNEALVVLPLAERKPDQRRSPEDKLLDKIFELRFALPHLTLLLRSSLRPEEPKRDAISVEFEGLAGQFVYREYDIGIFLGLHALFVRDHLQQWGDKFAYLASSAYEGGPVPSPTRDRKYATSLKEPRKKKEEEMHHRRKPNTDLIKAYFFMVQRDSPEYKGVDNALHIAANAFHLMLNRDTVVSLLSDVDGFMVEYTNIMKERDLRVERWKMTKEAMEEEAILSLTPASQYEYMARLERKRQRVAAFDSYDTVIFRLTGELARLSVTLNKEATGIANFAFGASALQMDKHPSTYHIKGMLGNMTITDLAPGELHAKIAEINGEKLVEFTLDTFDPAVPDRFPGHNCMLKMRLNSGRFVVLRKFIVKVLDYFTEIKRMRALLSNAATIVAEVASEAVEQLTAQYLFRYDIIMLNPILLIPRSSTSLERVIADLGHISVSNRFEMEAKLGDGGMIEHTSIALTSMNMQAFTTSIQESNSSFHHIVHNLDVLCHVVRPLAPAPSQIKVSAHVSEVDVVLTQSQYSLVLGIYRENYREGYVPPPKAPTTPVDSPAVSHSNAGPDTPAPASAAFSLHQLFVTLQIAVALERITLTLEHDNQPKSDTDVRDGVGSVVQFKANKLRALVNMCSDESITVDFSLQSLWLTDTRPIEQYYRHLLSPNSEYLKDKSMRPTISNPSGQEMVADEWQQLLVHYVREGTDLQRISVLLDHPRLLVIPDAIHEIKDFLWPGIQALMAINDPLPSAIHQQPIPQLPSIWEVIVQIREPELWLIADAKQDLPGGLVAGTSLFFHYMTRPRPENPHTELTLLLENTHISKRDNPSGSEDMESVLPPMDISIRYDRTASALSLVLHVDPIHLTVSYQDYILLSKIVKGFLSPPEATPKKPTPLSNSTSSELILLDGESPEKETSLTSSSDNLTPAFQMPPIAAEYQTISVEVNQIRFTVINDCMDVVPLIDIRLIDFSGKISSISPEIDGSFDLVVEGEYYNLFYASWEPIIEPCPIHIEVERTRHLALNVMRILNINVTKAFFNTMTTSIEQWKKGGQPVNNDEVQRIQDNTDTEPENAGMSTPIYVQLTQNKSSMLSQTVRNLRSDKMVGQHKGMQTPIILVNSSGQKLKWWFPEPNDHGTIAGGGSNIATPLTTNKLRPGEAVPLTLCGQSPFARGARARGMSMSHAMRGLPRNISLLLYTDPSLCFPVTLPLQKMGTYLVPLGRNEEREVHGIYEVSLIDGTKVLNFRSNILIINETSLPLLVEVERLNTLHHYTMPPIAPGDSAAVPIWPAKSAASCLRFKPASSGQSIHQWSETPIGCSAVASNCVIRCPSNDNVKQAFFYGVSVDIKTEPNVQEKKENKGDHIIRVAAPIVIENVLLQPLEMRLFDEVHDIVFKTTVDRGDQISLHQFDPSCELKLSITVPGYKRSKLRAIAGPKIKRTFLCTPQASTMSNVELNMHNRVTSRGVRKVSIYAQFWMINRTGLPLAYQQAPLTEKSVPDSVLKQWQDLVGGDPSEWYKEDGGEGFGSGEQYTQLAAPVMFAFHKRDIVGNKVSLKIADSKWSKPFSLESAGYCGVLELSDRSSHYGDAKKQGKTKRALIAFQLCVAIELAPSKFRRTKIVTISPLFVLINMMDQELYYTQAGLKETSYSLLPNARVPFHWPDGGKKATREVSIKLGALWTWSGSFSIDRVGEQIVKHRHRHGDVTLTRVEVRAEQGTHFVFFYPGIAVPPYSIHNYTPYTLTIYQKDGGTPQKLAPYERIPYCWDLPSNRHYLAVELEDTIPEFQKEYCLDKIKQYKPIRVMRGGQEILIAAETSTDGPTRVLKIIDQTLHASTESAADQPNKLQEDIKNKATTTLRLSMHDGFGISVIDATPQEIMYICVQDLALEYCNSDYYLKEYVYFTIARFQVDNQLFFTPFPVVAAPHLKLPFDKPFVKLTVIKSQEYKAIDYYKYLAVSLQELDVSIDETFLLKLFAFANIDAHFITSETSLDQILTQRGLVLPEPSNTEGTRKMYLELLHINPIQINLSFVTVPAKDESEENPVRWAIGTLGMGIKVPNIDNAPIRLNALILQHPFATKQDLLQRIAAYYQQQAILEAYKVLGSFDFLGNPVSLVSSLGTGFKDFFYAPYLAVVNNPRDLGEGLGKGTSSLIKKSIYGLTNSVSKVTDSVAKGVSKLALSKDYVIERDQRDREAPKNVGEGLLYGARDLGKGVLGGVTGVFVDPVMGAKNDGASGLFRGVAQGVLGAAVRPSVGVLDVFTKTTRGIRNQADDLDRRGRVRLRYPRYFGRDKLLEIYSEEKAYGQAVLYSLSEGRYINEWYCFHVSVTNHSMVLVSNQNIFLVSIEEGKCKKDWRVLVPEIRKGGVEKVAEGVQLSLEPKRGSISYLSGAVSFQGFQKKGGNKVLRRLIEVKNKQKRDEIHQGILHVVEEPIDATNWIELYSYE